MQLPFTYRPLQFLSFIQLGAVSVSILLKIITPLSTLWAAIAITAFALTAASFFGYWAAREGWAKHIQFMALALCIGGLVGTWL